MNLSRMLALAAGVAAFVLPSVQARVEVGQAAPDFKLTDIDGHSHTLSEYQGKIVVLGVEQPRLPDRA